MSAATLEEVRGFESGFGFEILDPATVPGVIRSKKAAGKPWTQCKSNRLLSWELAFGRLTTDMPCKVQPNGTCRKFFDHKLVYIQVRTFFGEGLFDHMGGGLMSTNDAAVPGQPHNPVHPHDHRSLEWEPIDARSGAPLWPTFVS